MNSTYKYAKYSAIDFVMDDSFKQWVQRPTPADDAFWQQWQLENPGKKTVLEEARQMVLRMKFKQDYLPEESTRRIWHELEREYDKQAALSGRNMPAAQPPIPGFITSKQPFWQVGYKAAAVVALLVVTSVALYFFAVRNNTITYTTPYAQTRTITLPDQSVVTLNANSTLAFSKNWKAGASREVWLQGEAFFHVKNKHDGKTKFTVHTAKLDIEVLGTAFNVNNRRNNTVVVLNSGRVKLRTAENEASDTLVMKPGEQVIYSEEEQAFTRKRVNPESVSSWIHQKLIFEDTPLLEIARLLEDNYGFKVRFRHPDIASKEFTATIPAGNINTLLTAISESFNIPITRQGKELLFN